MLTHYMYLKFDIIVTVHMEIEVKWHNLSGMRGVRLAPQIRKIL